MAIKNRPPQNGCFFLFKGSLCFITETYIFCARVANDPVKFAILTWGHMSPWSIFIIPRGPHLYWWYTIVIYMMLEPPSRQRLWITEIYHCNTWLSLPTERELNRTYNPQEWLKNLAALSEGPSNS
jgi:hypothetical protein